MAKEKEVVNSLLTKTQAIVMKAICTALGLEPSDKKVIGKKVDLTDKDGKVLIKTEGIPDVPKVCRQLNREQLVIYRWNEDRSRTIEIVEEGFKQLNLPLKERTFPAKKEKPAKAEKKSKDAGVTETDEKADAKDIKASVKEKGGDSAGEPLVKSNSVMKNFLITLGGKKKIHKAKDKEEFDELCKRKPADWLYLFEG